MGLNRFGASQYGSRISCSGDECVSETIIAAIIAAITTIISLVFITFYFSSKLKPFESVGVLLEQTVGDETQVLELSQAVNSLVHIGVMAQTMNQIFQDEALLEGLLTTIAQKAVKIFQMSVLGTKSGDSRKAAKAEAMVNEAMIVGMEKLNPVIGIALKATGLDEELRKDPEMFQYIMQVVMDKGLLNMLDPSALSMPASKDDRKADEHGARNFR